MANPEHVEKLLGGHQEWNGWRSYNPDVIPDLTRADLRETSLEEVDLHGAYLGAANLGGAVLDGADLSEAHLRNADLTMAHLREANLSGTDLSRTNLRRADFSKAYLGDANLSGADLSRAGFQGAYLYGADLCDAQLNGADLSGAQLTDVELSGADLTTAILAGADLSGAWLSSTLLANIDLRGVKGLESVRHRGPSTLGLDTFFQSKGRIPDVFLRGVGAPDLFIQYASSLVGEPFEFYSCFISYSTKDKALAERLYSDLQGKGVRCWFAPEDLKTGDKLRIEIDKAIRTYDKLLLLLSRRSVGSDWVEKEVERAFEKERTQKRPVLFPVRLDNSVMKIESGWPAAVRRNRHIGNFTQWKDRDAYQKAFVRLLRDLKADRGAPTPTERP